MQRINGTGGGSAHGDDYGADATLGQALFESADIHAAVRIALDGFERQLQNFAESRVGVVRLIAGENCFPGLKLAGDPEGFEIGHRSAAAEMAEKFSPAEHGGDFGDGFFFHGGSGASAVERVIVGIDEHRQRVGQPRDRVRAA